MSEADQKMIAIAAAVTVAVIIGNAFWKNRGGAGLESFAPTGV